MSESKSVRENSSLPVWVLALMLLFAIPVVAQSPTGVILVRDTTGASIPKTVVTVTNVETGLTRTMMTGSAGAYSFPALPVGHYTVKAEHTGFMTETRRGLVLAVTQDAVLNFTLQIVVTGQAPQVNTTNSSLGGLVNPHQMEALPLNGRNYIDLALLQPGVMKTAEIGNGQGTSGTWFSSNGAPMRSNNITLDGARMTNAASGSSGTEAGTTLGVDGLLEFQVVAGAYGAQYGMSMGSQVVMVSKGGTNQFHGDGFEYLRNSTLDARNFFDYGSLSGGTRLPYFQQNNFGGSFGGPIRKNK